MQSEAIVALTLTKNIPENLQGDYIGADKGALFLAQNKIPMRLAIGDFDSVTEEEFALIRQYAKEVIRLNPIKDDSDSQAALNWLLKNDYETITFLDALGGRADQAYVNLMLAYQYPEKVRLLDEQNEIYALNPGSYKIYKEGYPYISFFTFDQAVITLENMKYSLDKRTITINDLYTLSNEITDEAGTITIYKGKVLVIQSGDKKRILSE